MRTASSPSAGSAANYLLETSVLPVLGRDPRDPRPAALTVNNVSSAERAVEIAASGVVHPRWTIS